MKLLSIYGVMGLYVYIAQVIFWRGCDGDLSMIWTKWKITKVVVNEWLPIWFYELFGLMSSDKWRCYDFLNMIDMSRLGLLLKNTWYN